MPDEWAALFTEKALTKVDAFVATHPEYTRHGVKQPGPPNLTKLKPAQRRAGQRPPDLPLGNMRHESPEPLDHSLRNRLAPSLAATILPRSAVRTSRLFLWRGFGR